MIDPDTPEYIDKLRESLTESLAWLRKIPDPTVFGVKEIHGEIALAIRYVSKLEDHYLCPVCGELNTTKPSIQYFKAKWHEDCFRDRFGDERLTKVKDSHGNS